MKNENNAIRNRISDFYSTKNPINKQAMNNRILLIVAEFHFVHPEPAIRSSDTGQRIPCFDSCQLITTLMSNGCVHYQFSCALKLARKYEIEHWSRSSKTINWSADRFQINHVTSMSWHMSPRYGHVILVSGYPVLTAVNWLSPGPYCKCPM